MGASLSMSGEEEGKNKPLGVTSVVLSVLKNNQNLQKHVATAAHNVEVFNNIFTFAEPRVSLIVYGLLFAIAFLAKIWISFFSVSSTIFPPFFNSKLMLWQLGSFAFLVGSVIILSFASAEFLTDQIPQLHSSSVYHKHITAFRKVYAFFSVLVSKVPDDLELTHR